jgi:hypothetical protein
MDYTLFNKAVYERFAAAHKIAPVQLSLRRSVLPNN